MLRDLLDGSREARRIQTQVVVVGGGIAGLLAATRLAQLGVRTVVLESGGKSGGGVPHALNEVVQAGQSYRGAIEGRFRGLGGTSTRWGGAMLPFQACDMGPHTAGWPADWPVTLDDIEARFGDIQALFGLPTDNFEIPDQSDTRRGSSDFVLRSAKWPEFRQRNLANTLSKEIESPSIDIWVNATAVRFELDGVGQLSSIVAASPSGAELIVEARLVVFAAGAIENTRLMLQLDSQYDDQIFKPMELLGKYFFDHLTATAGTLEPTRRGSDLNKTFGLRFQGAGMRDTRLEPSPQLRASEGLPGGFAHVAAMSSDAVAFAALRGLYRDLQSGAPLDVQNLLGVGRDLGWLAEAAWWRFAKRRLLAPRDAEYQVVLVTEQFPSVANTITLSSTKFDMYGVPLAQIDWRPSEVDFDGFRRIQDALESYWTESRFGSIAAFTKAPEAVWRQGLQSGSDIFHPGGTTRMGRNAKTGVVDANLRSFQVPNLYVIGTSVFPTGGSANPTFTLMAFALRAAEHIAREVVKN